MTSKTTKPANIIDDSLDSSQSSLIQEIVIQSKEYHVYLYDEISDIERYIPILTALNTASENDVFHIHINSYGGEVPAGMQLVTAMSLTRAKCITYLEYAAYSMAALLFLSGDEQRVCSHSMLMIHNYTGGVYGKGHELKAQLKAQDDHFSKILVDICSKILTPAELSSVLDGSDLWISSEDLIERYKNNDDMEAETLKKTADSEE